MSERFGVVLADCPWLYANFGAKKHGAARGHYPGMTAEELGKIPVGDWAADDAILLQWATAPKLLDALDVVKAWGFEYVTKFPWIKVEPKSGEIKTGIGFWGQGCHEDLLICRRGKPTRHPFAPIVKGLLVGEEDVFYAPVRKPHSTKPLELHAWVESTLAGPYLEIFARRTRPNWTTYGNELGTELGEWGVRPCEKPSSVASA